MPDDVLELADKLWRGEAGLGEYHPVSHLGGLAEICDGVAFVPSFATRAEAATSTMAKGVFSWAAQESLDEACR